MKEEVSAGPGAKVPYALPKHLADPYLAQLSEVVGRRLRAKLAFVNGLAVEIYQIPAQRRGASTLLRIVEFLPEIADPQTHELVPSTLPTGTRISILTGRPQEVRMVRGTALPQKELPRTVEVAQTYAASLLEMSRLTGWKIYFHMGDELATPPYPEEPGVIHLLAGASPPGQLETHAITHVCGVQIDEAMERVTCRKPVQGRGLTLRDEQGTPIAQIIENTVYLLIPVITHHHGRQSVDLFRKLLVIISNGLLARKRGEAKSAPRKARGRKAFVEGLRTHVHGMPDHLAERVRGIDEQIRAHEQSLRRLYLERRDLLSVREALASGHCQKIMDRLPMDYLRIRTNPHVDNVYLCDGGVHVDTKLVVMTNGITETRYPVGRFTIRIGELGAISIWPIETRHPTKVPHPHISKQGFACYGNGTQAIIAAACEMRYADAFELVLRWLTEGYLAESAANKLEEWPIEEQTHA